MVVVCRGERIERNGKFRDDGAVGMPPVASKRIVGIQLKECVHVAGGRTTACTLTRVCAHVDTCPRERVVC